MSEGEALAFYACVSRWPAQSCGISVPGVRKRLRPRRIFMRPVRLSGLRRDVSGKFFCNGKSSLLPAPSLTPCFQLVTSANGLPSQSIYLFIYLSIYQTIYLSSVYLSIIHLSIYLSKYLSFLSYLLLRLGRSTSKNANYSSPYLMSKERSKNDFKRLFNL